MRVALAVVLVLLAAIVHALVTRADPTVGHWLSFAGFVALAVLIGLYLSGQGRP